jgi:hypothetical protein
MNDLRDNQIVRGKQLNELRQQLSGTAGQGSARIQTGSGNQPVVSVDFDMRGGGGSSGAKPVPAVILSGSGSMYVAAVYANGLESTPTDTAAVIHLYQIPETEYLDPGTIVTVFI